jgi:hypothetical protein
LGDFFAHWVIVLLRKVFENDRNCHNFGSSISLGKWFGQFWGEFFSQTHLVTLSADKLAQINIRTFSAPVVNPLPSPQSVLASMAWIPNPPRFCVSGLLHFLVSSFPFCSGL